MSNYNWATVNRINWLIEEDCFEQYEDLTEREIADLLKDEAYEEAEKVSPVLRDIFYEGIRKINWNQVAEYIVEHLEEEDEAFWADDEDE